MSKRITDKTKHLHARDVCAFKNYVPGTDVVWKIFYFITYRFDSYYYVDVILQIIEWISVKEAKSCDLDICAYL